MNDLIVRRRVELLEAEVNGELVALEVAQGTCYGFNGTATRIWGLIAEPRRVSELRDALLRDYDVDAETCETQLRDLLAELEQDGLIELSVPTA